MSLLGYDMNGTATINGLSNVNANYVYGDELYYDASTIPVNVKTAINAITIDITALQSDVLVLQSDMNTAQSDINTLQSDMNTAQSDINTLQSDMNTAQADIIALYSTTATSTAAIAGLVISQAAQDVTLAAHTASIAGLNGDVNTLQSDVSALQVKTTDQSWGSLSGTTFSTKVNIGGGVTLRTGSSSQFDYGLSASDNISTTGTLSSTSGTSQVSSLLVNNNFEVTNSSFFGDTIYVDRAVLTNAKKVVLYDNSTSNDYDYLGFWTDSGTASKKFLNAEIDGVSGSAFQWYYGNNLGSARTLLKSLTSANEISYAPLATFLKSSGFSQQIQLVKDAANNKVRIDMIGDTAGLNVYDGQIIQLEGNGVDDNRGLMTIQSGDVTLNALSSATTGTLQLNSKVLDINNTGAITIDSASTINITSVDDMILQTTNPFGDVSVVSAGTTTLTSTGTTNVNTTGTAATSIGNTTGNIAITGATNTILGTTNINATGGANTAIGTAASGTTVLKGLGISLVGSTLINDTGTAATSIGNTSATLQLKGSTNTITGATNINHLNTLATTIGNTTGVLTLRGATNINTTGTATTTIGSATSDTTITGTTNINTSGNAATNIGLSGASTGNVYFQGQNINFLAYNSIQLEATNAYWTNIGQGNFYYRAYNGAPQWILGNQTTAVDYMSIQSTSTGSTITVYYSQPLTLSASAVTANNLVAASATLTTSTITLSVPLQMENAYTTYPITTATAIGRYQSTTGTTKFTGAATNILSLAIPRAGCYIVEAQWYFSGTVYTAQTFTTISISTTSGVVDNTRQITAYQGGASGNYAGHITSVVNFTAASTAYFVGLAGTALGATSVQNNFMSITRIA